MIVMYDNTIFDKAHNIMGIRYAFAALIEKVEELTFYIIQHYVFFKAWRDPAGDDEESFFPIVNTNYALKERTESSSAQNFVDQTQSAGLSFGPHNQFEFNISPNPTNGEITFTCNSEDSFTISILDITGQTILELENIRSRSKLNLDFISAGTYILRVSEHDNVAILIKSE